VSSSPSSMGLSFRRQSMVITNKMYIFGSLWLGTNRHGIFRRVRKIAKSDY
jgi:hypothetical protein